jgi:hypothetical protein
MEGVMDSAAKTFRKSIEDGLDNNNLTVEREAKTYGDTY